MTESVRDAAGRYAGPIVDAHHHLWDLALDRHPWLRPFRGKDGPFAHDHLPADYLAAAARHNVAATVHVEANWDRADPYGEIAWLDGLKKPDWMAVRYVAEATLADPAVGPLLERYGAHARVVGVRDIVSWHPDPAKAFVAQRDMMNDTAWRRGFARLQRHGLSFDLLITPWQAADAVRLAADFPDTLIVLNHCGSPMDRDAEGMARWRAALRDLACAPNMVLKVSDLVAYDNDWTLDSLREVTLACIDAFGVDRCMFASDYPVAALHATFDDIYDSFRTITAGFSDRECAALFETNARRVYRL